MPLRNEHPPSEPAVRCAVCGAPVESRRELIVAGRVLTPCHKTCFPEARRRAGLLRPYAVNGRGFWFFTAGFNLAWLGLALAFPHDRGALLWFLLAADAMLTGIRLTSWLLFERRLPR